MGWTIKGKRNAFQNVVEKWNEMLCGKTKMALMYSSA